VVAATLALVMIQIFTVGTAIAAVTPEIATVSALVVTIAAKVLAVVARLTEAPIRAVVAQLAPISAPIPIVGAEVAAVTAEVATIAAEIAPIAAEIAPIRADVAGVAANVAGSLQAHGRLRARDRYSTAGKRHREPECNQFIAKHREILQRPVGTRPLHRAVRGCRRGRRTGVKGLPLPSVSRKRWYRSAPGWTDAFRRAEFVAVERLTHKSRAQ
jgi:hypothetical protein